ncbi:hypothetical protein DN92_06715 [Polynucleobacter arcticus]|uniref:Uncharacterized protein n=1 Tax=Polynucleobacter arcticus TaxID=1743165 RepID=A0A6M9PJU4_9BURK|nr:hypothetical protein DN92_06715 [Polynucleobacter arcticus]
MASALAICPDCTALYTSGKVASANAALLVSNTAAANTPTTKLITLRMFIKTPCRMFRANFIIPSLGIFATPY